MACNEAIVGISHELKYILPVARSTLSLTDSYVEQGCADEVGVRCERTYHDTPMSTRRSSLPTSLLRQSGVPGTDKLPDLTEP